MQESNTQPQSKNWHAQSVASVLAALRATPAGLTVAEAAARLLRYGQNRLPEAPARSALSRFLQQFHHILIYVLLGSAVITLALGHVADTAVILAVVIANAVIGFVQEGKAEKAMEVIRRLLAPRASVLRGGERCTVDAADLVPGDVVLLEAGDRVPADLRLIVTHGTQIQEAILTGESLAVEKDVLPVAADAALGDRVCMAFGGTLVTTGQSSGIVVATGAQTEIGRISGLLSTVEALTTPLVKQMDVFARWQAVLILTLAALLLAFGYFVRHYPFTEMFMIVVGLSVAAIPEGLPAVLSITLAIGVRAMARRNAIVRRLPAIETLGSVSVICTDKTGTLTRNEMAVVSVATAGGVYDVKDAGYAPAGEISMAGVAIDCDQHPVLAELGRVAVLCTDATLREQDGAWSAEGDPMEAALLAFAGKTGVDWRAERRAWPRTDAIPFDAKHRFMATLHHDHEGHASVFVKGAPERVIAMCREQRSAAGSVQAVDAAFWLAAADHLAAQGKRVLALASRPERPQHTVIEQAQVEGTLTLLALVGLIDPPRQEAIAAVAECRDAGIRVKMITGDHAGTARAIARQIGLLNADDVLTGVDLDAMDAPRLATAVLQTDVFARTTPEHKLRLVMALQSHDQIVAMTGDGVNDAPALKRADAGIAMGRSGTEAAKEASELVLADDNFASIVAAVREGRTVYDNIRKVISWTLPTNGGEAMVIVVALLAGMAIPVTAVQILWVNLVTEITLGIALAFEPTEDNTMRRPPRARNELLLDGGLVWHVILVAGLFVCGVFGIYAYAIDRGYAVELARTIAVNTLVVLEMFHLFFIRNIHGTSLTWKAVRGTPTVWLTVAVIVAAQCAFTYLPSLQRVMGTAAVSLPDALLIIGVGMALFAILEIEKQLRLRLGSLRAA